jgi:uncharacterized protein (TIGR03545 family)
VSGLLFGSNIQNISTTGLSWYKKVKPLLASDEDAEKEQKPERQEGQYIHFSNKRLPEFWLKKANISAEVTAGEFAVTVNNLTTQQHLTGLPITAVADSTALKNIAEAHFELLLDYRAESHEQLIANIKSYKLDDMSLSKDDSLTLSLAKADVDAEAVFQRKQKRFSSDVAMQFADVEFTGSADSTFAKELLAALQGIKHFTIDAQRKADDGDYSIRSDLDKQVKAAIQDRFKQKQAELERELEQKLNDKLNSYLADANIKGMDFSSIEQGDLKSQIKQLDDLLEQELDDYEDQQKEKAKDKAKDKLKNEFKKLF